MKSQIFKFSLFAVVSINCLAVSSARAEEENRMAKGAMVGAGTNVIGGAVLDSLDGSSQPQYVQSYGPDGQPYWQQVNLGPQEDPNRTILKRAVQGAITGAVAAEMSGDDKNEGSSNNTRSVSNSSDNLKQKFSDDDDDDDNNEDWKHGKKSKSKGKHKDKEGHRPPGWDRGKKVGWGDGDVPPGHQDDIEHPEVESDQENQSWWSKLFNWKNND